MRSRTIRRSVSSWVSPGPRVPMPPAWRSRCFHMPVSRGIMYSSCASSTWSRDSRVRARRAKMARISSERSTTLISSSFSRLRTWAGERSSSKIARSASRSAAEALTSATLPFPMKVAGWMVPRRWTMRSSTRAPAVPARFSSSSIERARCAPSRAPCPTSTARSAWGGLATSWIFFKRAARSRGRRAPASGSRASRRSGPAPGPRCGRRAPWTGSRARARP